MKEKIHPDYRETTIVCVCGEVIKTRSTKQNIHVDLCSKCHPFFTGKQKLVDSAGRVEKFSKRYAGKIKPRKAKVRPEPGADIQQDAAPAPDSMPSANEDQAGSAS